MKTKLMSTLAIFALAGLAAYAQSVPIKANVPFDFIAGGKTMEAGKYTVERVFPDPAAVLITSDDSEQALFILTLPVDSASGPGGVARLVFNRYGNTYFLCQIWGDGSAGRKLRKSKKELEMAGNFAPVEVALVVNK